MQNENDPVVLNKPPLSHDNTDEYELYYGTSTFDENDWPGKREPGPLSRRPSISSVIPVLIISSFFILCTYSFSSKSFSEFLWASRETVYSQHEYWRLLTAIFAHAGTVHLLSNLPLFFFFGFFLYEYFGFIAFPAIPLIVGVGANALTLYFYNETTRLVGASGMVYGMVSLWLVLYIYHDSEHTLLMRIFRSAGFALIILFPSTYDPSTSYMAHASGFFIGILSAVVILPFIRTKAT